MAAPEFTPRFGDCPTHGPFPLNVLGDDGRERWTPGICPACARQAQIARLMDSSGIPRRFLDCQFDGFEVPLPAQKKALETCRNYAADFAAMRQQGVCLVMHGNPGTGKSHLAAAISRVVLEAGFSVLRVKAAQYLDAFWAKGFEERDAWLSGLAKADLLVLDELGKSANSKAAQDAFFRLIDARYEALGEAGYDRLAQGGLRLEFTWGSWRPTC
jgi:DNA replication protein DnaC